MNVFISGGCKNGKSNYAQRLAFNLAKKINKSLYYIATMIPTDNEDQLRIKRHIEDREGLGFITIEQGKNILLALENDKVDTSGVFLLDSVTALLANEMFPIGKVPDLNSVDRVVCNLIEFASKASNTIFVSDYIYNNSIHRLSKDFYTSKYMKGLAKCDKSLCKICDEVIEVAFGFKYLYKNSTAFDFLNI